jgi:hypothetical protein
MDRIKRQLCDAADSSGLTKEEIGVRMGFQKEVANESVVQLLRDPKSDPTLSQVLAFADAVKKPLKDIIS